MNYRRVTIGFTPIIMHTLLHKLAEEHGTSVSDLVCKACEQVYPAESKLRLPPKQPAFIPALRAQSALQ